MKQTGKDMRMEKWISRKKFLEICKKVVGGPYVNESVWKFKMKDGNVYSVTACYNKGEFASREYLFKSGLKDIKKYKEEDIIKSWQRFLVDEWYLED